MIIDDHQNKIDSYNKYNISQIKENGDQRNKVIFYLIKIRKRELKIIYITKIITFISLIIIISSLFLSPFFPEITKITIIISIVTFIVFALVVIFFYIKISANLAREFKKNNINYCFNEIIKIFAEPKKAA